MASDADEATKQRIVELYSRVAPDYATKGPPLFAHAGRRLVALAGVNPGDRVLDLATGRGAVLIPAAQAAGPSGWAVGIDLAPVMIEQTEAALVRDGVRNAEVRIMDAEHLTFADASFDVTLCSFAVFFFPNLPRTLQGLRRVLVADGRVGFAFSRGTDPRWQWYPDLLRQVGALDNLPPPPGNNAIREPGALVAALNDAGFRAHEVVEQTTLRYPSVEAWWRSLWTHGTRRPLERLAPDDLARFKAACVERMAALAEPDGSLHERQTFVFILGNKLDGSV